MRQTSFREKLLLHLYTQHGLTGLVAALSASRQ